MRAVVSTVALACLVLGAVASVSAGGAAPERKVTLRTTGSGWPACDPGVTQRSGYLDINAAEDKHYFYWMFEAKTNPATAPVILWMTGGPGCSSQLAILAENGPCHVNEETGDLYNNPYSWNNVANVIYIDQPAGVGFSYANFPSGYDHNETMVSDDMYAFFQAFYKAYPQYQSNPLFIYGESYGGHYAPATAHRVWKGNQANEGLHVPLAGLSVGNGMTDPSIQFNWYSKLAYQWCNMVKGAPCVSEATYNEMRSGLDFCNDLTAACNKEDADCSFAFETCTSSQLGPFENTGLNVYDVRIPCKVPGLCYDFSKATAFLNRADVQQSLGVAAEGITWQSCNMQVNQMFGNDWMRDFNDTIPDLLGSGVRVMIYSGDVDFICNWLGNKAWSLALEWPGKASFNAAHDQPWWVDMESAGRIRTVSGNNQTLLFSFVQVHDAGHMVPMNQPQRALDMVSHFLADKAFYGYNGPQPAHNIPTPAPQPTQPTSSPVPAPSTPAPSAGSFTQKVCTSSTCTSGCQSHSLPTGECLGLQNGMSAVAKCLATELQLTVYSSADCSGAGFPETQPLNSCGEDQQGSYIENICSSSSVVAAKHKQVRMVKKH